MSVTISIFEKGEKISEDIYEGAPSGPVFDLINSEYANLKVSDVEVSEAKKLSSETGKKYIGVDDTNVLGYEGMANFISECVLEYDEQVYSALVNQTKK